MKMLLSELIEKLQDLHAEIESDLGETAANDAEVRLAIQPNYPMQHEISDRDPVYVVEEETEDNEQQVVAYIAEGGQSYHAPYLPGPASDALGWR